MRIDMDGEAAADYRRMIEENKMMRERIEQLEFENHALRNRVAELERPPETRTTT